METPITQAVTSKPNGATTPKLQLFDEGLRLVMRLTGRRETASRIVIGELLRDAGQDPEIVLAAVREAARVNPMDPIGWIKRAIQHAVAAKALTIPEFLKRQQSTGT